MPAHFPVHNHYEHPTLCVDLDGTLALGGDSRTLGEPNWSLIETLEAMRWKGWQFVVQSARPTSHHPLVVAWLVQHELEWLTEQIVCGGKPAADAFIDDKGLLPPHDVLWEWAEWLRCDRGYDMWTEGKGSGPMTIETAACWENPDAPELEPNGDFRVVVPASGGVDSTVAWAMAHRAGLPVVAMYVDTGAAYSAAEIAVVQKIENRLESSDAAQLSRVDVKFEKWLHVDRGRNAVIAMECARHMTTQEWWGEIWFGNLAEWAETPIRGGDKSHRWLLTMQQLLTLDGHDVRLFSPLGGMSKSDAVAWAVRNGYTDLMLMTRSCYEQGSGSCGRCRSCFRRWLAFEPNGLNVEEAWPYGFDFRVQISEYVASPRGDGPEWHPRRTAEVDQLIARLRP